MEIDLIADVGEGFDGVDRELLDVITSANVACGLHAGDEVTARRVCEGAVAHGVAIGAHVSYRDRDAFGRRELGATADVLGRDVAEQIAWLAAQAETAGGHVAYVKPHGALYHRASVDVDCAEAIVRASHGLPMLAFPGSELERAAGASAVPEGFADRGYAADGSLVPRGEAGAVLDEVAAAAQARRLAAEGRVRSLCVHGDTPGAPALARCVRDELARAGIAVRAFA